jgi:hypothetical protein
MNFSDSEIVASILSENIQYHQVLKKPIWFYKHLFDSR